MKETFNIEDRKPIWTALSEFYLDTELQDVDFISIASAILKSPYSIEEVKQINKYEVFPVLQPNLLSVAGEWVGFDHAWLISTISDSLKYRNIIKRLAIEASYATNKWMCRDYWKKLEQKYVEMQTIQENSQG
jgi:hypothetical protein